MDFRWLIAA